MARVEVDVSGIVHSVLAAGDGDAVRQGGLAQFNPRLFCYQVGVDGDRACRHAGDAAAAANRGNVRIRGRPRHIHIALGFGGIKVHAQGDVLSCCHRLGAGNLSADGLGIIDANGAGTGQFFGGIRACRLVLQPAFGGDGDVVRIGAVGKENISSKKAFHGSTGELRLSYQFISCGCLNGDGCGDITLAGLQNQLGFAGGDNQIRSRGAGGQCQGAQQQC